MVATKDRAAIAGHLAECDQCLRELIEVARDTRTLPRQRWVAWVPLGVAASVATFLILRSTRLPGPVTDRGAGIAGASSIVAVIPASDARVTTDSVVFAWRPAAPDVEYRLLLTDHVGNILWSVSQPETSSVLPASIALARGQSYFWYVDALFPDGHTATSGPRHFETRP